MARFARTDSQIRTDRLSRTDRLIRANRLRVPQLNPFFREAHFGALTIANRRF